MSDWDALRQKSKGAIGKKPTCSECGKTSAIDPCRVCEPVVVDDEKPPELDLGFQ